MRASPAVHFVGISGIGMSALARILLQRGVPVSGSSDRRSALTDELEREGATIAIGHAATNVGDVRTLVVSSAIDERNPEVVEARARSLEIVGRGALLARLMAERRGIAIAGTHGKTTTTAMTAAVVEAGGFDPTVALGGVRVDTNTNARSGKGEWFVAESDESDRSFLAMKPEIAVVTNIENDHIASDDEMEELIDCFERFLDGVPANGLALVGIDEARSAALASRARAARTRTFGFGPADVRATGVAYEGFGSRARIELDGRPAGELRLGVPGAINISNALPALALGLELGMTFSAAAEALANFRGVRRRFDILARTPQLTVVDDYAHHPTAVAQTLAAARAAFDGPIVAIFQPHRYTRTEYLAADFARALAGADRVVLTDVYAASETPIAGVGAESIGAPLRASGTPVDYVPDVARTGRHILETAPPGALALFLGAGSISNAAHALAAELAGAAVA